MSITPEDLGQMIDHSLLAMDRSKESVIELINQAYEYGFGQLCVPSADVRLVKNYVDSRMTQVTICATIGFPHGTAATVAVIEEAKLALAHGATELDMVFPHRFFRDGEINRIHSQIEGVVQQAKKRDAVVKVILETHLLNLESRIRKAGTIACDAGADFIKTCTGYNGGRARESDVRLMAEVAAGYDCGVKASGGIRDYETAVAMIRAGANRIGTSSGVKIIKEARKLAA